MKPTQEEVRPVEGGTGSIGGHKSSIVGSPKIWKGIAVIIAVAVIIYFLTN